jgi:GNAT superfamily N-acetyltransferase
VRPGTAADAEALVAMHERCSADVLLRRYQAPVGRLTLQDAGSVLEPEAGRSLVVLEGNDLVAAGLVVREGDRPTLALHVEDDRQRRGIGSRLFRALAIEAARLGWEEVICVGQPGDRAVLATVRRAGLVAVVSYVDGTCHHRVPLTRLREEVRRGGAPGEGRSGRSAREELDDLLAQSAR